ncbi:MAG: glycosyltransferase [SAR202 cluster bacterium]|nr:glycosyltransferase [SAR202 cluster bacterium]|tara:strand:- start:3345 stop:4517 length:1173 start_codon:yes stop_codon:yes gene_type:complete
MEFLQIWLKSKILTNNMKILFAVRSLNIGGTERQIISMSNMLINYGHEVDIARIYPNGDLEKYTKANLHTLSKNIFFRAIDFHRLYRHKNYDVAYSFLPNMNIFSLLISKLFKKSKRPKIVWGIRSSYLDPKDYSIKVNLVYKLEKMLSGLPDLIITNSDAALNEYKKYGFPRKKIFSIPNIIDHDHFKNLSSKKTVYKEFGISNNMKLIGIFARIHPMKDHMNILQAIKIINETSKKYQNKIYLICVGGIAQKEEKNNYYKNLLKLSNQNIKWLGSREDIPKLMSACDLNVLCSDSGEGFPNSVAESMSCETPIIATNIGDSKKIINNYGKIVPVKDSLSLANSIIEILEMDKIMLENISIEARKSIINRFSEKIIYKKFMNIITKNTN